MKVRNISINEIEQCLSEVNKEQGYQLYFNTLFQQGNFVNFTLGSPSKVPGSRISSSGRNLAKASWHAHGYLFDKILDRNPHAEIRSLSKKIYKNDSGEVIGNWEDWNCGSIMQPVYMSETSL